MSQIPSMNDLDLDGRAVFLRLDLNVPMKDGVITSDARIRASLPTIEKALLAGARVAIASHFGRPKGGPDPKYSLEPVAVHLASLLNVDVLFVDDCVGDGVKGVMQSLHTGQIALLENLRFHPEEEAGDINFAKRLAAPFSVYINDAFGASHRKHASIVGVPMQMQVVAAGLLMEREAQALGRLLEAQKDRFVAIVGGAKVSDKLGVMRSLLNRVDTLCIGGAMAYTFLKASGVDVGISRIESDQLRVASDILLGARARGVRIMLPTDHIVAHTFEESARPLTVENINVNEMGLDIGPRTAAAYAEVIKEAKTIFWNGPMGVFEWPSFAKGTQAIAQAVAGSRGYSVVGGGDSVAAVEASGVANKIDHISTGGGASLEFLELGGLPGIDALTNKVRK